MTRRRMLHLPALLLGTLAAAVLLACAAASLAVSEKAEATLPGKNGRIAYSAFDVGAAEAIYTINPGGGDKSKLTSGYQPSYSPDGRRIAYTAWPVFGGADAEIYTINVRGGYKTQLTHNNKDEITLTIRPTARGSSTRAWQAWRLIMPSAASTRSRPVGAVRPKLPTPTTWTTCILPTRPTARRSSTRCGKASPPGATSTRSTLAGGRFRVTHGKADEGGPAWGVSAHLLLALIHRSA